MGGEEVGGRGGGRGRRWEEEGDGRGLVGKDKMMACMG